MKIERKIIDRLEELVNQGEEIRKSYKSHSRGAFSFNYAGAVKWKVNCLSYIEKVFGDESVYRKQFEKYFNISSENSLVSFGEVVSVISAAKEDYENGYLLEIRALIEAEVFDDFLEQADYLLSQGYFIAAAVISGSVLEDALRKLCSKNGISLSANRNLMV